MHRKANIARAKFIAIGVWGVEPTWLNATTCCCDVDDDAYDGGCDVFMIIADAADKSRVRPTDVMVGAADYSCVRATDIIVFVELCMPVLPVAKVTLLLLRGSYGIGTYSLLMC